MKPPPAPFQYGDNNRYFLPDSRDLPHHGLMLRMEVFDFGYASPNNAIAPYDTGFFPLMMGRDFLVTMVNGTYEAGAMETFSRGVPSDRLARSSFEISTV